MNNSRNNGYLLIFINIGVSFILLGAITDILFTSKAKKTEQN